MKHFKSFQIKVAQQSGIEYLTAMANCAANLYPSYWLVDTWVSLLEYLFILFRSAFYYLPKK